MAVWSRDCPSQVPCSSGCRAAAGYRLTDPGYMSRKIQKFRTDKFDTCNKRGNQPLHELQRSKFPLVTRIEFIRSKLSIFPAHVSVVTTPITSYPVLHRSTARRVAEGHPGDLRRERQGRGGEPVPHRGGHTLRIDRVRLRDGRQVRLLRLHRPRHGADASSGRAV